MATNIRISGINPGDPREESDIRMHPTNPQKIICASTKLSNDQPIHYSSDGGVSWGQSSLGSIVGNDIRQGDPAVDWTMDGTAWSLTLGISVSNVYLVLRCFKSMDGGATWQYDSLVSGNQTSVDKESLWVDHSPTSPFQDNMYAIWDNSDSGSAFLSRRQGPGGTWSDPIQLSGAETLGTAIGTDIKTNANGDLFAFWPDTTSGNLYIRKSVDGGVTFSGPVQIATTFSNYHIGVPAQDGRKVMIYISGGAYRSATADNVYALWTDLAGGNGCSAPGSEPGSNVDSLCKTRIWFAQSLDGGSTWQPAVKINDQNALNDQFFPRMVVDPMTGDIIVVYYDTIADPKRVSTDLWSQFSIDGGASWSAPEKITSAETNETTAGSKMLFQYGDYIGLTGYGGKYFACWTDSRGGGAEEIWGSRVPGPIRLHWPYLTLNFGQLLGLWQEVLGGIPVDGSGWVITWVDGHPVIIHVPGPVDPWRELITYLNGAFVRSLGETAELFNQIARISERIKEGDIK
jgi:hypothetical protein